jgi:L-arabinose isomerase
METLKSGDVPALVTNIEVMNILASRIEKRQEEEQDAIKKPKSKLRHRDFIEESVYDYLQTTPCANVDFQKMPEFVARLSGTAVNQRNEGNGEQNELEKGFELTDADKLQILNHMPSEAVESHLMVEELSSRMNEDRQNELLQLISEYAGEAPIEDEGHDEEPMEEVIEEDLE